MENRKYHRKSVNIPGKLLDVDSKEEIAEIRVTSLSVDGFGFVMVSQCDIRIDDVFEITFKLDEIVNIDVSEKIIVKRADDYHIGAEFYEKGKYSFELDFYLTPISPP
jgi:hypothetical protein